jgi:hypothetical protein
MMAVQLKLYEHVLAGVHGGERMVEGIKRVITGRNKLHFRKTGVFFECVARKMSGDPDTALSNAIDNLVCISYLLFKQGVQPDEAVRMFFVEGDDNIGSYGNHILDKQSFLSLGLNAKPITPKDCQSLDSVGFCQLYGRDGSDVICANPWKKLAKLGRVNKKYIGASDKVFQSLLRAEALSTLSLHSGAPVVSTLALKALELTKGVNVREKHVKEFEKWGLRPESVDWKELANKTILMEDRVLVEKEFGMTVEMQLFIEEAIQQWKGGELILPTEWFPSDWTLFSDEYVANTNNNNFHMSQSEVRKELSDNLFAHRSNKENKKIKNRKIRTFSGGSRVIGSLSLY